MVVDGLVGKIVSPAVFFTAYVGNGVSWEFIKPFHGFSKKRFQVGMLNLGIQQGSARR